MEDILLKQVEFQNLLKNDITSQKFLNAMFLGLFEEIGELMATTPHKAHKKNQQFNRTNFLEELVDVQLYLLNLAISTGVSWYDFKRMIQEKQELNFKRQKENY